MNATSEAARESARQSDGKFGTQVKDESPVDLCATTGLSEERIEEALGCSLDELSVDDRSTLGRLLDPTAAEYSGYDSHPDALLERWEGHSSWGFEGDQEVASQLVAYYQCHGDDIEKELGFGFDSGPDGDIGSYTTSVYLGYQAGSLVRYHDPKYLTADRYLDNDATGLRKALATASVIDGDLQNTVRDARLNGLDRDHGPVGISDDELHVLLDALGSADASEQAAGYTTEPDDLKSTPEGWASIAGDLRTKLEGILSRR